MLLSAEYATTHRNAVLAYDAANEIGLGIVIAHPQARKGPHRPAPHRARRTSSRSTIRAQGVGSELSLGDPPECAASDRPATPKLPRC